jgi:hypothetical protein
MHQGVQDGQSVGQRLAASSGCANAQVAAGAAAPCELTPHSRLYREQLGVAPACIKAGSGCMHRGHSAGCQDSAGTVDTAMAAAQEWGCCRHALLQQAYLRRWA